MMESVGTFWRRGTRQRPEQQIHRAVVSHLSIRAKSDCYWFHPPNGGKRTPTEASILTSLGVKAGIPDLILIRGGQTFGLELKTECGRVTDKQQACHGAMREAGATVETAYGLDEALYHLKQWGLIR